MHYIFRSVWSKLSIWCAQHEINTQRSKGEDIKTCLYFVLIGSIWSNEQKKNYLYCLSVYVWMQVVWKKIMSLKNPKRTFGKKLAAKKKGKPNGCDVVRLAVMQILYNKALYWCWSENCVACVLAYQLLNNYNILY